ncbi:hypothetical protein MANES_04G072000v8 [Manihot esculenta]|uniref:BHLH domain-containing protein n=2 Tax=Manihot esculenta TaxID=3983 RepID=A0A251L277_MANES|nr:hypothetical protein MANES_04G072000v8 [Manihot esculenta]OAY52300.1 hypothetical protein MANES_04G072000v8 [Manihot esculenta]
MIVFQDSMERLRPLVGLKGWDYCVLWKLSDDQRFLEWIDCCCGGNENMQNGAEELQFPVSSSSAMACRDVIFQHPRTKSCELLAQLPSSMPLDSGVHAQTLLSNQPRWLNFSNSCDSSVLEGTVGTRALIPVAGGIIELFVTKQVSEDQNVINFITSQCSILMEQEAIINSTNMETGFSANVNMISEQQSRPFIADGHDTEHKDHQMNQFQAPVSPATALENLNLPYDISADRIHLCDMKFLQQFNYNDQENKNKNDMFFEGVQDMDALQKSMVMNNTENMHMKFTESSANKEQQGNDKDSVKQENGRSDSISDCSDQNDDENDAKYRRRPGRGPQAKNLFAERRRRKRLNGRLYDLRALVPKISNLNKAAILGDAIEFVKELQKQAKELQDELEEHSDDERAKNGNHNNNIPQEILNQNGGFVNGFDVGASEVSCSKLNHKASEISHDKGQQMEVQVEVAQIDGNEFFVKVFCEHKPGGFVRLMEALDSLGLEVTNANVTSFRGLVSNVLKVEKKDSEMVQADYVRDSLLELTRDPPTGIWSEMAKASENGSGMDYHHHQHHHHHNHHHQLHNGHVNSNHHHLHS